VEVFLAYQHFSTGALLAILLALLGAGRRVLHRLRHLLRAVGQRLCLRLTACKALRLRHQFLDLLLLLLRRVIGSCSA